MVVSWADIPKQTFLKENGQVGDCWRCCVAAVLGLAAEEVPHFLLAKDANLDPDTQRWLNARGSVLVYATTLYFPRYHGEDWVPLPVIACGPSPRSTRLHQHHAVVMLDDQVVYDPHPSEAGLTAIIDRYLIVPVFSWPSTGLSS